MDIEKAIAIIKSYTKEDWVQSFAKNEGRTFFSMSEMIVQALEEKKVRYENPLLTLEQMMGRIGKPVYGWYTKKWYVVSEIIDDRWDCRISMSDGEDFEISMTDDGYMLEDMGEDFYDYEPKVE